MPTQFSEWTDYLTRIGSEDRQPLQAKIREEECIGCLKCLRACPVDAIVGAPKQMHTVIMSECTGCELCVEPCPVDCIDMVPLAKQSYDLVKTQGRFEAHIKRLALATAPQKNPPELENVAMRKAYIVAALARVKAKRG